MELKIRNGDYIADGIGGERRADGAEALLERALFRLYTAAALAEETALTVEDVELTERGDGVMALRVLLTADGESAALEMTVRGA